MSQGAGGRGAAAPAGVGLAQSLTPSLPAQLLKHFENPASAVNMPAHLEELLELLPLPDPISSPPAAQSCFSEHPKSSWGWPWVAAEAMAAPGCRCCWFQAGQGQSCGCRGAWQLQYPAQPCCLRALHDVILTPDIPEVPPGLGCHWGHGSSGGSVAVSCQGG